MRIALTRIINNNNNDDKQNNTNSGSQLVSFICKLSIQLITMLFELIVISTFLSIVYHYIRNWHFYKVWWQTPGPWSLPYLGSVRFVLSIRDDPLEGIGRSVVRYGGDRISLWLGPRYLFVTQDPKDIEIILTHPDCIDKFDMIYDKLDPLTGSGLIRSKTDHWRRHRKLFAPAFSKGILDSFVDTLYKNSCYSVEDIRENYGNEERDIAYFTYNFAVWAYCNNFMGVDVRELNRKHHWGTMLAKGNRLIWQRMFEPAYFFDFIFHMLPKSKKFYKCVDEIRDFAMNVLKMSVSKIKQSSNDKNNGAKRKNLIEIMLELEAEQKLSSVDLRDEVTTILIGGTDTTALAIGFTTVILGMYPEIQETVHQEVLEVCGRNGPITLNHLTELKYLERVLNEVLRLFPLVPQVARQTRNYIKLGDIVLPPGTGIGALVFNVQRDERFWKDPLKFDPDRFLPEECAKRNPFTFMPFLLGPRNCIGFKYAMLQLKIVAANFVRNFKFSSKYKTIEEIKVTTVVFTKMKEGFLCKLEARP